MRATTNVAADARVELLRGVPVLAGLEEPHLERLAAETELVPLAAGEWLFRAGDEADAAFVISSGQVEIVSADGTPIGRRRRGVAVGELALLRGGRRSASVRARRDSTLIALRRQDFERLLADSPTFVLALMSMLAERLAHTAAPTRQALPVRTLAVVALGGGVDARDAARTLAEALARHGTAALVDEPLGAQPADWPGRLGRLEAEHDRVVLAAGGSDEGWEAFCLRDADLAIALTRGAPDARAATGFAAGDCELLVLGHRASAELVAALRPRGVRAVADAQGLARALHAIADRVAGRSVGVVLSGGGARAFAHVGALEELVRAGVRIERIGGVSLGAVVAAFFARRGSPEGIYASFEHYFVDQRPTSDYTLPVVSLLRGRKTARMLTEEFGGTTIESLRLPFFCASADLLGRALVLHRAGPLDDALLAGLSIPGVFPPMADREGRLLVDGGVIDNLPVQAMAEPYEGPVIAIDVTGTAPSPEAERPARAAARSGLLRRALTGSDARLPTLPETIVRCMTLASADTVAAARRHADLVITPGVAGIGLLDWRRLAEMRAAGAAAARAALESWPSLDGQSG